MKTSFLSTFSTLLLAAAALLLPARAHAQYCQGYCDSFAVYNPDTGTIDGDSHYENYWYGGYVKVQVYLGGPNEYKDLGYDVGWGSATRPFSYVPTESGLYWIEGDNYYQLEGYYWYVPDGYSYTQLDVQLAPPPPPQITVCPGITLGSGGNQMTLWGSGFLGTYPSFQQGGNNGNPFLDYSNSWISIVSDNQLDVHAAIGTLATPGWLAVIEGAAFCLVPVAATLEPDPPPVVSISGANQVLDGNSADLTATVSSGTPIQYEWSWSTPPGASNNPNPPLNQTTGTTVKISPAHWFALPNVECPPRDSTYAIKVRATTDGTNWGTSDAFSLTVSLPQEFGFTSWPTLVGGNVQIACSAMCVVVQSQANPYSRTAPVVEINFPLTSQFYMKVSVHESTHVNDWTTSNSDLWNAATAWDAIRYLSAATFDGLRQQILTAELLYQVNSVTEALLRSDDMERRAFRASDPIAPPYFPGSCAGY